MSNHVHYNGTSSSTDCTTALKINRKKMSRKSPCHRSK